MILNWTHYMLISSYRKSIMPIPTRVRNLTQIDELDLVRVRHSIVVANFTSLCVIYMVLLLRTHSDILCSYIYCKH